MKRNPYEVVENTAAILELERIQLCIQQEFQEQGWQGLAEDVQVRITRYMRDSFAVQVSMHMLGLPDKDLVKFSTWATPADAVKWWVYRKCDRLAELVTSHERWDQALGRVWLTRPQRLAAWYLAKRWAVARVLVMWVGFRLEQLVHYTRRKLLVRFGTVRYETKTERRYLTACPHIRAGREHNPKFCVQHMSDMAGL